MSHWLSLASPSRRCLENTPDSDPQLALIHPKYTMPSRSPISITWKSVEGGARILARVVVTTRYVCPGVPRRSRSTSTDSHSSHTVVNVQVSCLSLWSLKLSNRYSCSHARVSKRPPADLAIHHCDNTLRAAKRATRRDVIHSMHTFACLQLVYCFTACFTVEFTIGLGIVGTRLPYRSTRVHVLSDN